MRSVSSGRPSSAFGPPWFLCVGFWPFQAPGESSIEWRRPIPAGQWRFALAPQRDLDAAALGAGTEDDAFAPSPLPAMSLRQMPYALRSEERRGGKAGDRTCR